MRLVDWPRVNPDDILSAPHDAEPELDALVLVLHEGVALLGRLHYRLTAMRLLLLDGNPRFIQSAAHDVDAATKGLIANEARTLEAISTARRAMGTASVRLIDIASEAPGSHRKVLLRISREIETTSRSIAVLRDTIRTQADGARRAVTDVLDLRTDPAVDGAATGPGHIFRGKL